MKFQFQIAAALLLIAGFGNCQDVNLKETEKQFQGEFGIIYHTKEEEERAAQSLKKSEDQINDQNKKFQARKSTFYEQLNKYSDVPREVFQKEREGAVFPRTPEGRGLGAILPPESEWYTSPELEELYLSRQDVPNSYDATARGLVTPVKDQMSCGSCAAFAVTGAHETCMLQAGARYNGLDLSEQMIIDCGFNGGNMNGCHGAHPGAYGKLFANILQGQSPHEVTYPYLNTLPKLTCPTTNPTIYNSGAYVMTPMEDFMCDETKLKQLVSTYGAVVTAIYASDRAFGQYANGVFQGCTSDVLQHAVLVVGYGTENGVDYWLVKNSWGLSWGDGGKIKIKRGSNECGIGSYCYAAKCEKTTGTLSEPPVLPPPKPIPAEQECDISAIFGKITGNFLLRWSEFESRITCTDGICRPTLPGPSNACMYICGELECK